MDIPLAAVLSFGVICSVIGAVGAWIWFSERLIDQGTLIDQNTMLKNNLRSVEGQLVLSESRLRNAENIINELTVEARTQ